MKSVYAILLLGLLSCQSRTRPKLTVAVAANMQYTIAELIAAFNRTDGTEIEVIRGASGNLAQQIMSGAPFDIFISADKGYPGELAGNGFTIEPPRVYAQGQLVLWSTRPDIAPRGDLKLLLDESIKRIAIANPKTAPYGQAAVALLEKYDLYDKVRSKLVTGESITQTTQFIATQSADIGFTAKAIVVSGEMKGKGKWVDLNGNDYPAIGQSAALLKYARQHNEAEARKFYNFLYSAEAKAILIKYGYLVK